MFQVGSFYLMFLSIKFGMIYVKYVGVTSRMLESLAECYTIFLFKVPFSSLFLKIRALEHSSD